MARLKGRILDFDNILEEVERLIESEQVDNVLPGITVAGIVASKMLVIKSDGAGGRSLPGNPIGESLLKNMSVPAITETGGTTVIRGL